ncbi:RluA family pseudouridine synthase [Patescibacteria group bacterium]|nr:RluA family pseudouridine synthase [Patescibacteria group bacterium]
MSLNILFENATLQVVDKPAGIDIEGIQKLLPEGFSPAHRLDKDTSGVLLVAKTRDALEYFRGQFQTRKIQKTYLCLVQGNVRKEQGEIEALLGRSPNDRRKQKVFLPGEPGAEGKREASSKYRVLKQYQGYAFLEVKPKTGRKHQIRIHLSHLGHPIAGDRLYGFKGQQVPKGLNRQFLHAHSLQLTMPDGTTKEFTSELSEDLQEVLMKLKT